MKDWDRIKEKQINNAEYIISKTAKYGVDFCDVMLVEDESLSIEVRNQKLDSLEMSNNNAFSLRVVKDQKQAVVSSSNFQLHNIDHLIEEAVNMAEFSPIDKDLMIPINNSYSKDESLLELFDISEKTNQELTDLALKCEAAALSHSKITNSEGANVSTSKSFVTHFFSNGYKRQITTSGWNLSASVIAEENGHMERDYEFTIAKHFNDLVDAAEIGNKSAINTIKRLGAMKAKTSKAPIIFAPRVANRLLGKFLSAINGDLIAKQGSFLVDKIGHEIFNKNISIIEDPHLTRGASSKFFDSEGTPTYKKYLLENGELKTYLLNLKSAKKLNMNSTANASRDLGSTINIGVSNVYIVPGTKTEQDLIKEIDYGIYITDVFGSKVNLITGDYSQGAFGFVIEKGQISHPVNEFTIASNLQYMFKNMQVADNLEFKTAINCPSIFIEEVTIAGN